ncbi:MAG: Rid family detoxifying hydrolase [Vulcanimicrobiota bacterium]
MKKVAIKTDRAPAAIGPYSQGIKAENLLFISGQLPINPDTGEMIESGIANLAIQCINNIRGILEEAGGTLENLVKVTIYCTDLTEFKKINQAYEAFFTGTPPARAVVEVQALPMGSRIEIEAIAFI